MKRPPSRYAASGSDDLSSGFLDLFYPIHYMVGIKIEDTLRCGVLTRQQACILWMIRTQGVDARVMRRKDIERSLTGWFEVSSSAISKALRSLSRPPLNLVHITEAPGSGREKVVELTPEGERFLLQMIDNGRELMKWMLDHLTEKEANTGVDFLARVSEIFESANNGDDEGKPPTGQPPRRRSRGTSKP